jgi:membrane-associated phospholipid phosphatase
VLGTHTPVEVIFGSLIGGLCVVVFFVRPQISCPNQLPLADLEEFAKAVIVMLPSLADFRSLSINRRSIATACR